MRRLVRAKKRLKFSRRKVKRFLRQLPYATIRQLNLLSLRLHILALFLPFGRVGAGFSSLPPLPWSGDIGVGERILDNKFEFDGMAVEFNDLFWDRLDNLDNRWLQQFYDFHWVKDVVACSHDTKAAEHVRYIINKWWNGNNQTPVSRHSSVVGARLANWISYRRFICRNANMSFKRRFLREHYVNILFLEKIRHIRREKTNIAVLKAIIFMAIAEPKANFLLYPAIYTLHKAIKVRFLPDGGHFTRSPEQHLLEAKSVLEIISALRYAEIAIDDELYNFVQQIINAAATLSHSDNSIALFNDSTEQSISDLISLWQSWGKSEPAIANYLPDMQFARLENEEAVLLTDVGAPIAELSSTFYGTLGFEFSYAKERIFVNCGGYRGSNEQWRKVCRFTAAHTALSIDDINNWQPSSQANYTLVIQSEVSCQIKDELDKISLEAAYNGYVPYAGLVHYRKLSLIDKGNKLEGVDMLTPHKSLVARGTHRVQIRFHLHPNVTITRISRGAIELQTVRGQYWRFITPKEYAAGAEESVYLGRHGKPRKTMQLAIEAIITGQQDLRIYWELVRIT